MTDAMNLSRLLHRNWVEGHAALALSDESSDDDVPGAPRRLDEKEEPMDHGDTRHRVEKEVRFLVPVAKSQAAPQRITYGVVLEPDTEDLQGDVMSAEDIEKAAYDWMERSQAAGYMHSETVAGAKVVESYIAPCDIPVETAGGPETIRKGSWVLGMRWPEHIWKRITDGELTGYSVGGTGVRLDLEDVGKAGKWAPGPNAGWRKLEDEDGSREDDEEAERQLRNDDDDTKLRREVEEDEARGSGTYAVGDRVAITYSTRDDPAEIEATGTLRELERPSKFRYADHLVADLDSGETLRFDDGGENDIDLWSVSRLEDHDAEPQYRQFTRGQQAKDNHGKTHRVLSQNGPQVFVEDGGWIHPNNLWPVKKSDEESVTKSLTDLARDAFGAVLKSKWAPGPNAGWKRTDGSDDDDEKKPARARPKTYHSDELGEVTIPEDDDSPARPEDEERDEELRRSRRAAKPKDHEREADADGEKAADRWKPDYGQPVRYGNGEVVPGTEKAIPVVAGPYGGKAMDNLRQDIADRLGLETKPQLAKTGAATRGKSIGSQSGTSTRGSFTEDVYHATRIDTWQTDRGPVKVEMRGYLGISPATDGTYRTTFWATELGYKRPVKKSDEDPIVKSIADLAREAFEDVLKASQWAPGPNAGWKRIDETEANEEAGRAERDRWQPKPKENAEDAYGSHGVRSFKLADEIEELLQDQLAPSDEFQPSWGHATEAAETERQLTSILGILSGDPDAVPAPADFATAEDAYSARMTRSFDLMDRVREKLQDRPAPGGDEFQPHWGHVGEAARVNEMLDELRDHLKGRTEKRVTKALTDMARDAFEAIIKTGTEDPCA